MIGACLSSKEERVVLYAIKREPSDLGECVIRRDANLVPSEVDVRYLIS